MLEINIHCKTLINIFQIHVHWNSLTNIQIDKKIFKSMINIFEIDK